MAILNINMFIERKDEVIQLCTCCQGRLEEIPITKVDALLFIFQKKRILKRFKCADCNAELKTEK